MPSKLLWLAGFIFLYGAFCLYQGMRCARQARISGGFELANRSLPTFVFVPALTAGSFAGWLLTAHPGNIYRDGFSYAYLSLFVIVVPLTGVIFFGRLWALSRQFNFVTPGQMISHYFRSEGMRVLVGVVALGFALPILILTLKSSGALLTILSDETIPSKAGIWLVAALMFAYVGLGGFRAVANVGVLQAVLLVAGVSVITLITLSFIGGWDVFLDGMTALAKADEIRNAQGHSHYLTIPNAFSGVEGSRTVLAVFTSLITFFGVLASPVFFMWAFAARSPAAFAPQQIIATGFVLGILVVVFMAIIGVGGHFLGADLVMNETYPDLVYNVLASGLGAGDLSEHSGGFDALIGLLINLMGQTGAESAAALSGFLAICALAAMQAAGGAVLHTASVIVSSDGVMGDTGKWRARCAAGAILAGAIALTMVGDHPLLPTGALALGVGLQMWPCLLGICYLRWFTKHGVVTGLVLGLLVTFATSAPGLGALGLLNFPALWAPAPWGIAPGFLGIIANFSAVVLISLVRQHNDSSDYRARIHHALNGRSNSAPLLVLLLLVWFFFAAGPGAIMGNTMFGNPGDAETWLFSMPSIWIWQLLWWAIGVFMLWFLARKLGFENAENGETLKQ